MRLENQKKSENFVDMSWFYNPPKIVYPKGRTRSEIGGGPEATYGSPDGSYVTNPYGDLTPDEIHMLRSGAKLQEILFKRALDWAEYNPYIQKGNYKIDGTR